MVKFDFFTYTEDFITKEELADLLDKKSSIIDKFNNSNMIGWIRKPSNDVVEKIINISNQIKTSSKVLVVVGVGGSYLGSLAYHNIFESYFNDKSFEVIYAGYSLSSTYLSELQEYLKDKDFSINVISKSGSTLEVKLTYQVLRELLEKKYSKEEARRRIYITTSKNSPLYLDISDNNLLEIPSDIGGRFSFITPAHLLVLSLNYDITKIIDYYFKGLNLVSDAYTYAVVRNLMYTKGFVVENFSIYEEKLSFFTEWLKQLFAESEGKDNKGILPISTINTRDLHSLGQFIQDGKKILFETHIKIDNSTSLNINDRDLHDINNIVEDAVIKAHSRGNVPSIIIELDKLSEENISSLICFFQLAAAFSAYLFDVNPFDQPGVEVYKEEANKNL